GGVARRSVDLLEVDADRKYAELASVPGKIDDVTLDAAAEAHNDVLEALEKAARVKADDVGAEQTGDDLTPARESREHLDRRKRDMQKETNDGVEDFLSDQRGDEGEMEVVQPQDFVRASTRDADFRKAPTHRQE